MAEKTKKLTIEQVLTALGRGGQISAEDKPLVIPQLGELIDKVGELLVQNQERIKADTARNQSQLEIIATLQALIRQQNVTKSHPLDLAPLKSVLTEISEQTKPRQLGGYEFTVTNRDRLGDIEKLRVEPISPTKH